MNNLKKIKIQLNGRKHQIKMGYNLKDLLKILKKDNNKVAIELNGEIADKKKLPWLCKKYWRWIEI